MKLIATPVLVVFDEVGAATFRRGNTKVELTSPIQAKACLDILNAFQFPGLDLDDFILKFETTAVEAVSSLIDQMKMSGFLVPDGTVVDNPEATFWRDFLQSRATIDDGASRLEVVMVGKSHLTERVAESLQAAGAKIDSWIDDPMLRGPALETLKTSQWTLSEGVSLAPRDDLNLRLIIACTDIGAETHLRPWNEFCVDNNIHFLPISLKDNKVNMGPYVRPHENACFECARGRINANAVTVDRADEEHRHLVPHAFGWHPILLDTAASLATAEVLRQTFGCLPALRPDHIIADPIGTGTVMRHGVLRLPRCPVCSPIKRHSAPMVVDSEDRNAALIAEYQ